MQVCVYVCFKVDKASDTTGSGMREKLQLVGEKFRPGKEVQVEKTYSF